MLSPITLKIMQLIFPLALLLLLSACNHGNWRYTPTSKEDVRVVYVTSHGWHTGIVIPATYFGDEFNFLKRDFGNRKYFELGWGNRDFYQAEEVTVALALRAIVWPSVSIMHVVAFDDEPKKYFSGSEVIEVTLSKHGSEMMLKRIYSTFKTDKKGETTRSKKGLYGESYFYESIGSYHVMNTCNTWTAEMLASGGMPTGSFPTLSASGVISLAKNAGMELKPQLESLKLLK